MLPPCSLGKSLVAMTSQSLTAPGVHACGAAGVPFQLKAYAPTRVVTIGARAGLLGDAVAGWSVSLVCWTCAEPAGACPGRRKERPIPPATRMARLTRATSTATAAAGRLCMPQSDDRRD